MPFGDPLNLAILGPPGGHFGMIESKNLFCESCSGCPITKGLTYFKTPSAILDWAGSAALQAASKCPLRRWAGIVPYFLQLSSCPLHRLWHSEVFQTMSKIPYLELKCHLPKFQSPCFLGISKGRCWGIFLLAGLGYFETNGFYRSNL